MTTNTTKNICAVVLAGGRGQRMGGLDKGLQPFGNGTLVENAVQRLRDQTGGPPAAMGINANRNIERYTAMGLPVWPDVLPDFAGPLAGFLSALEHNALQENPCAMVATVPCDSPLFPLDLLERMAQALEQANATIAMAVAPEPDANGAIKLRRQPVFSLMHATVADSLQTFLANGGRKIDAWMEQHRFVEVRFDRVNDNPQAFANANTLDELRQLNAP